jgi:hypothetical protein
LDAVGVDVEGGGCGAGIVVPFPAINLLTTELKAAHPPHYELINTALEVGNKLPATVALDASMLSLYHHDCCY